MFFLLYFYLVKANFVIKGIIDGVQVAVKKLREDSVPLSRLLDLGKEVSLLAPLYHRNLVKLLGFCIEAGHYVLVYEFIDNKDLGKHLKGTILCFFFLFKICFFFFTRGKENST